ncbi:hypothetical protein FRC17_011106 [Serendipita sp. 399]|nr:hypothetical protein FRC17_011106 [Serendipita sp. 399]
MSRRTSLKDPEDFTEDTRDELVAEKPKLRRIALGDFLAVLSLLAIVVASIVVIVTTFVGINRKWDWFPSRVDIVRSGLASLTVPVLSTILRLLSQRYLYARLSHKGLRSRRVANFNNWTVAEFISQIFALRFEPLGALFLAIWLLAAATGFTVRDSSTVDHVVLHNFPVPLPYGSLDPGEMWLVRAASDEISELAELFSIDAMGTSGYIEMIGSYEGTVYYPYQYLNGSFTSTEAIFNALQVNISQPQSIPSSAYKLHCTEVYGSSTEFWSLSNTTTGLSFIHSVKDGDGYNYTQVDSTAIGLGGKLSYYAYNHQLSYFQANGTTWPLTMSNKEWASQLMEVVCTTYLDDGILADAYTLLELAIRIHKRYPPRSYNDNITETVWSTVMGTALGGFINAKWTENVNWNSTSSTHVIVDLETPDIALKARYGIYILIANTAVAIVLLLALWGLLRASPLNRDFLDSTRLLLSPLDDRQLFNASLDETILKLEDPYLQVVSSHRLRVTLKSAKEKIEKDSVPPLVV